MAKSNLSLRICSRRRRLGAKALLLGFLVSSSSTLNGCNYQQVAQAIQQFLPLVNQVLGIVGSASSSGSLSTGSGFGTAGGNSTTSSVLGQGNRTTPPTSNIAGQTKSAPSGQTKSAPSGRTKSAPSSSSPTQSTNAGGNSTNGPTTRTISGSNSANFAFLTPVSQGGGVTPAATSAPTSGGTPSAKNSSGLTTVDRS